MHILIRLIFSNTFQAVPLDTSGLFVRIKYKIKPIIEKPSPTIMLGPNSIWIILFLLFVRKKDVYFFFKELKV